MSSPRAEPAAARRSMPRLLAGVHPAGAVDLATHLALHGPLPLRQRRHRPSLTDLLAQSGLRGRGGSGFPAADKLRAVSANRGRPVVVVNAVEGEPVSGKDKLLLRHAPHLVLDGAAASAAALGARRAFVAVSESAVAEQRSLLAALDERGHGCDDGVTFTVATVPSGFVSGEETAVIRCLNGGPAKPTLRPPHPAERGVDGAPTLVHNAETLAHVALIARRGAAWFREQGTEAEPGTMLVTITGAVRRPGVVELAAGTTLAALVEAVGGYTESPSALLVGGYFGTWVGAPAMDSLSLADAELRRLGARLGAGVLVVVPDGVCAVGETARIARYLATQSAQQCGPCRHGLSATADALERLAEPGRGTSHADLERLLNQVTGRGACRHPDGAARLVASALDTFPDEFAAHRAGRCLLRRTRLVAAEGGRGR